MDFRAKLKNLGLLGERELFQSMAQEAGIGFIDLDLVDVPVNAIRTADRELATRCRAIPVKLDVPTLFVAIAHPHDLGVFDAFKKRTGFRIVPVLAVPAAIDAAIEKYYPET